MTEDHYATAWWQGNLEEIDHEIARLAMLCRIRLFEPGVIGRIVHNDASVCGTDNAIAFRRLHDLLIMHLLLRDKSAADLGTAQIAAIEAQIASRLAQSFPDLGKWPPV
jgi:hypothetical protein